MFAIDNREVIQDLRNKLNKNLRVLYNCLEEGILKVYEQNNENFIKFLKIIDVKLETAEDVVEMEKKKVKINSDVSLALHGYEDSEKILLFLLMEFVME